MVVLGGGGRFLMSEVPLHRRKSVLGLELRETDTMCTPHGVGFGGTAATPQVGID